MLHAILLRMRIIVSVLVVVASSLLYLGDVLASSSHAAWWEKWEPIVENSYCELKRTFSSPIEYERSRRGFLSDTKYDKAHLRFIAQTQASGNNAIKENLGSVVFMLEVRAEKLSVRNSQPIEELVIESYRVPAKPLSNGSRYRFEVNDPHSILFLDRFEKNQIFEATLVFKDGARRQFQVHPSGNLNFSIYSEMFQTCIYSSIKQNPKSHRAPPNE